MLMAWVRGKKVGKHPGYEDEIVSAIFAPLRYLEPTAQADFVSALVELNFVGKPVELIGRASTCSIEFWPNLSDEGRVEPDVLIRFACASGRLHVLVVEAKWEAALHDGQMDQQWACAVDRYGQDNILHLFIGRRTNQLPDTFGWNERRVVRTSSATWATFAQLVAGLSDSRHAGLSLWARDVHEFLSRLGHDEFRGFDRALTVWKRVGRPPQFVFHGRLIDSERLLSRRTKPATCWQFDGVRS